MTLNEGIKQMAVELAQKQNFSSRTALVEQLIREKHAVVFGTKPPEVNSTQATASGDMEK